MQIKYEIEFVNPKFAELYGRQLGEIGGARLKEPYAEVRKSLGAWLRDFKEARSIFPTGGAVPKFRFLSLVVDGKQLVGLGSRVVWCLHCEQVGPARLDADGDEECAYCGSGEFDLRGWNGEYESGKVYHMYSPEFMAVMDDSDED
jgi:PAS domain-containing protein